jgi:tripartite-type tricarboxylate transporter receptor subunit TctC
VELGLRDFVVEGWWAIYLPAGAPREAVERINAATNAYLRSPEAVESLRAQGVEALGGTPEDLAARTAAEVAKWREVVRDARIEPG